MLCGTNGAVAAMDRAYMSLRVRKPPSKKTVPVYRIRLENGREWLCVEEKRLSRLLPKAQKPPKTNNLLFNTSCG
ncbi:unnamed protein product [Arctia plantaginis]|uniref:Uncharacterized protein n=1 Tax=Arctia plantaginis TaxID=874455 RepID=A0A8S0ZJW3_ARCPL|nr:unnamed protein product [Arctia plantaginis]